MPRIGWIAQDEEDRGLLFDCASQTRFFCQRGEAGQAALFQFLCVEGVGEVEGYALVVVKAVAEFFEEKAHLEVADCIGRHHQFEGVEILENVGSDEVRASAAAVLGLELGDRLLGCLSYKGHGAGGGIEQGDAIGGEAIALVKFRLEETVQGAHDVAHDRFRRVINPSPLALVGVVLR